MKCLLRRTLLQKTEFQKISDLAEEVPNGDIIKQDQISNENNMDVLAGV